MYPFVRLRVVPQPVLTRLTLLTVLLGLVVVVPLPAQAGPSKKVFHESLTVSQGGAVIGQPLQAGTSYDFHFTLTNDDASLQPFASAKILVPSGYVVGTLSTDVAGYNAQSLNVAILVTSSGTHVPGIDHGQSIHINASITTPSTGSCRASWTTLVKQSNDFSGTGNDFSPADPAPITTTGAPHLVITTQPHLTQWDHAMAPAPVATAVDACGDTDATFTGAVTLADAGRIATGATAAAVAGVATFTLLTFNEFGITDTLTASAQGFTTATSEPFEIVQSLVLCDPQSPCATKQISDQGRTTLVSIAAATGPMADVLTATVKGDPKTEFGTCNQTIGSTEPPLGAIVTFNVTTRSKTVTMTLPRTYVNAIPNNGTPFMDFCLEVPSPGTFFDKFGNTVSKGLLPNCSTLRTPPCVSSRGKNAGNEILTALLPPGDPRGSWY